MGMRDYKESESGCSDEDLARDESHYAWMKYEAVPYWKLADSNIRLLWYRTVQEYSRLQLTFEKDQIPALAALIQRIESKRVGDRFLAGLWEKTLLLDYFGWYGQVQNATGRGSDVRPLGHGRLCSLKSSGIRAWDRVLAPST